MFGEQKLLATEFGEIYHFGHQRCHRCLISCNWLVHVCIHIYIYVYLYITYVHTYLCIFLCILQCMMPMETLFDADGLNQLKRNAALCARIFQLHCIRSVGLEYNIVCMYVCCTEWMATVHCYFIINTFITNKGSWMLPICLKIWTFDYRVNK